MKMFFVFDFAIVKDNAPGLLTGAFFTAHLPHTCAVKREKRQKAINSKIFKRPVITAVYDSL